MLKEWLIGNGKLDSITVEEKFVQFVEQFRSDKYVTVPWIFTLIKRTHSCSIS